ncbi:ROK family protein [Corynebacterium diphtheriae]|uniref:ROK family protein n=1 Tax=Corynebacterium diphtheriae TaxID=1717 RepID=UPI000246835A|nr:ROK family protein [Corynebacterium diphtheriae]AEX71089.1 ROK-family transcriptional regulator [Corynebacterium diphtheriae CDCE 8392]MBG9335990.1 ROK family protein [Corynebacterium diphtheriae bv. gravis]MCM0017077.1 ROK family protein [Corynebacterium diphtheriae bv. mitis]MCM0026916.1 ROK family protein [Corynebacterium diphtheriae bv. mitis]MCM0030562.1 ROK family protein [Corynebacterium diphtheriae bv. mitis]
MPNRRTLRNTPSFTKPTSPAASCLHLIRHLQPVTRATLVNGSGKSQPTVTRAVAALMEAHLVRERPDLSIPQGPGRPTIPIELAPSPWVHIGVAVGTRATYIGAYNTRGIALREKMIEIRPASTSIDTYIDAITTAITELTTLSELPLASIGISSSGRVSPTGLVTAANLGWDRLDIVSTLYKRIPVPIAVTSVITAIAGAEQQAQDPKHPSTTLIFYADDSTGAALQTTESITTVPIDTSSEDVALLSEAAVHLVAEHAPNSIVLAGSAFSNPDDARTVGKALRSSPTNPNIEIRVFPTHLDNARAAARAVALDHLIEDPLGLAKRILTSC